jgi:hypothetical protein
MRVPLFGQEHVDRYRETDGEEGHDWQGTTVLLLTTTGRNWAAKRTTPLIYQRHGDDYLVVSRRARSAIAEATHALTEGAWPCATAAFAERTTAHQR